jgi:hypothetical protein
MPRVYTPDDKAVQTPNSDTPYSMIGLDLRAEPTVLMVPSMEKERYFSIQLLDLYTHNFDCMGSRTTANDGGNFLMAGPGWKGEMPNGVTKVIRGCVSPGTSQNVSNSRKHFGPRRDASPACPQTDNARSRDVDPAYEA